MKTSRIQGVKGSLYRNQKLYLQANGEFQSIMNNDANSRGQASLPFEQNKRLSQQKQKKKPRLKRVTSRLVVKGMQLDESSTQIHNVLVRQGLLIQRSTGIRVGHQTYRTSI